MMGKSPNPAEQELFRPRLADFIDMGHELVLLSERMDRSYFGREFAPLYSRRGSPSKPVRLMVGCLLLKHLYNLGDETLACAWVMNPYMQYFCGSVYFEHRFPCDPSDLVHFRKRIGEEGVRKIFGQSVRMFGKAAEEELVVSDTTVQGNGTAFPTDAGLYKRVIEGCNRIAREAGVSQRQTYMRTSKVLLRTAYNGRNPRRHRAAEAAKRMLRTLAGRQVRELERRLSPEQREAYGNRLALFTRILVQTRTSKDKVYSIHKPYTACIAKGKASREYEFGNKVGLICTARRQIIVAIRAFEGNPHDSRTIEPLLEQMERAGMRLPKRLAYDRGGRGPKECRGVQVITPGKPLKGDTAWQRRQKRYPFRRRAGIEPVIGHLKSDHRMQENYLQGKGSATVNALLAAAAWNLKKLMKELREELLRVFLRFLSRQTLRPSFTV